MIKGASEGNIFTRKTDWEDLHSFKIKNRADSHSMAGGKVDSSQPNHAESRVETLPPKRPKKTNRNCRFKTDSFLECLKGKEGTGDHQVILHHANKVEEKGFDQPRLHSTRTGKKRSDNPAKGEVKRRRIDPLVA